MEHLQAFISDCDRRTELAKRRLAETQEELSAEVAAKANKVHELAEHIGKKLAKAEQLGAEGNVEDSLKHMEEVEDYRKKKSQAEQDYRNSMPASSYQQQKLRVCEVCSAYLGIHDNDRRLADHFGGKLHLGFIKIREKLDELKKMVEERRDKQRPDDPRRADRDLVRDRDSGDRFRNSRVQGRSGGNNSRHDRRRSRSRDRSQRGSNRSHDRSYRSRSRDRYNRQRNNYRDNKRGERSRSRDRQNQRSFNEEKPRDRSGERSKSREHRFSDDDNSRSSKTRDEYRDAVVEDLHQKLLDFQQEVVGGDCNNADLEDM